MFARFLTITILGAGVFLGAIGVAAAPGVALAGAGFGAFIGALTFVWARDNAPGDTADKARAGRRGSLIVGAAVTGGCLALTGFVVVLGPASGPVLLLLSMIAGTVWLWHRLTSGRADARSGWRTARDGLLRTVQRPGTPRHLGAPHRTARGITLTGPPAPMPWSVVIPANLSTPQLCLAWQRTYFALLDLPAGEPRAEVVLLRGRLLDEIERRDPDGFTRWLDTGARAGSDPGRYLTGER